MTGAGIGHNRSIPDPADRLIYVSPDASRNARASASSSSSICRYRADPLIFYYYETGDDKRALVESKGQEASRP
jgi:hypothetical protein